MFTPTTEKQATNSP